MLVGGPVGLAVLAGIAILKLASGHDAAAKAARDHAEELKEIKEELGKTAEAASDLNVRWVRLQREYEPIDVCPNPQ